MIGTAGLRFKNKKTITPPQNIIWLDDFAGVDLEDVTYDARYALDDATAQVNAGTYDAIGMHQDFPIRTQYGNSIPQTYERDVEIYSDVPGTMFQMYHTFNFEPLRRVTTLLGADVTRGDTIVTVLDATGITVGDIFSLNDHYQDGAPQETGWNYRAHDNMTVIGVSGTTITLDNPLNFSYTAGTFETVKVYKNIKLKLTNIGSDIYDNVSLAFTGFSEIIGNNITVKDSWAPADPDNGGDALRLSHCSNMFFYNTTVINGRYPVNISSCRDVLFDGVIADNARHPIDCNYWADTVVIQNVEATNCSATVEAHPSFNITFRNVNDWCARSGWWGVRAIGVTIDNCYGGSDFVTGISSLFYAQDVVKENVFDGTTNTFKNCNYYATGITWMGFGGHYLQDITIDNCEIGYIASGGYQRDNTNTLVTISNSRVGQLKLRADIIITDSIIKPDATKFYHYDNALEMNTDLNGRHSNITMTDCIIEDFLNVVNPHSVDNMEFTRVTFKNITSDFASSGAAVTDRYIWTDCIFDGVNNFNNYNAQSASYDDCYVNTNPTYLNGSPLLRP